MPEGEFMVLKHGETVVLEYARMDCPIIEEPETDIAICRKYGRG